MIPNHYTKKLVVHQTSLKKWLFRGYQVLAYSCFPVQASRASPTRLARSFNSKSCKLWKIPRNGHFFGVATYRPLVSLLGQKQFTIKSIFRKSRLLVHDSEVFVYFLYYHIVLVFQNVCHLGRTPQGLKRYPISYYKDEVE